MYEFHFFSTISIFVSITYFLLGYYILSINPKKSSNRLFFVACASISLWGLGEGMQRAATSINAAMPWTIYVIGLGSALHTTTLFHFWLEFSNTLKKNKIVILFLIYTPFIIFTIIRFFNTKLIITGLTHEYWGYSTVGTDLYNIYAYLVAGYTFVISFLAIKKSLDTVGKIKQQYFNIGFGVLVPVIIGTISQAFRPFLDLPIPEMTVTSAFIFITAITYAIKNYGLLTIDIRTIAPNIINTINDFVIAIDKEMKIAFINHMVINASGFKRSELIDQPIQKIISDNLFLLNYENILEHLPLNNYRTKFVSINKNLIPVMANVSILKDESDNQNGLVLVLRDTREIETLINNLKIKNNELEKMNQLMVGRELKMIELKKTIEQQKETLEKNNMVISS